jgi:hypothetical protein
MLSPVPKSRRAFATQASKFSRAGPGDDEIGLLRRGVLEYSSTLEHEAARFARNVPDDPLEADARRRAVAAVHHQIFDTPLARDIARERLCDGGPSLLWQIRALTIRPLIPALDGESGFCNALHVSTSAGDPNQDVRGARPWSKCCRLMHRG